MELAEQMRLMAIQEKRKEKSAWLVPAPVMSTRSMRMIAQSVGMHMEKAANAIAIARKNDRG